MVIVLFQVYTTGSNKPEVLVVDSMQHSALRTFDMPLLEYLDDTLIAEGVKTRQEAWVFILFIVFLETDVAL